MRLIDLDALPEGRVEWEDIFDAPIVDAVERIEYEKMKDLAEQYKFEYECVFEAHKEVINKVLPNRVEVVRCRDCKYWCNEIDEHTYECCTRAIVNRFKPTDFCSYGERKQMNVD